MHTTANTAIMDMNTTTAAAPSAASDVMTAASASAASDVMTTATDVMTAASAPVASEAMIERTMPVAVGVRTAASRPLSPDAPAMRPRLSPAHTGNGSSPSGVGTTGNGSGVNGSSPSGVGATGNGSGVNGSSPNGAGSASRAWVDEVAGLVDGLHFGEKVERALDLINDAYRIYGDKLVVANSLGKDSMVVWHLAKRVSPHIAGFIVTTRYKPPETVDFMHELVAAHPELRVFKNDSPQPEALYASDPDQCCYNLKVQPTRQAVEEMAVECWVTGLRCTEGRTRTDFQEIESRDKGLIKLNPILIWHEREVWQYLALHKVPVNPLYEEGYRSLGCTPCTRIVGGSGERAGRWVGTSKCGGECGIHTRPLKNAEPTQPI